MYDIGTRVAILDPGFDGEVVGEITEANFVAGSDGRRRAQYLVTYRPKRREPHTQDYLCGPSSLRAADFCCDGCDQWRRASQSVGGPRDPDGYLLVEYCWFCENVKFPAEYARDRDQVERELLA